MEQRPPPPPHPTPPHPHPPTRPSRAERGAPLARSRCTRLGWVAGEMALKLQQEEHRQHEAESKRDKRSLKLVPPVPPLLPCVVSGRPLSRGCQWLAHGTRS